MLAISTLRHRILISSNWAQRSNLSMFSHWEMISSFCCESKKNTGNKRRNTEKQKQKNYSYGYIYYKSKKYTGFLTILTHTLLSKSLHRLQTN